MTHTQHMYMHENTILLDQIVGLQVALGLLLSTYRGIETVLHSNHGGCSDLG